MPKGHNADSTAKSALTQLDPICVEALAACFEKQIDVDTARALRLIGTPRAADVLAKRIQPSSSRNEKADQIKIELSKLGEVAVEPLSVRARDMEEIIRLAAIETLSNITHAQVFKPLLRAAFTDRESCIKVCAVDLALWSI